MQSIDLRQIYSFQPVEPIPEPADSLSGGDIYYECLVCSGIVSSVSFIKTACKCGNLSGNGGSATVKDAAQIRVVRGALK